MELSMENINKNYLYIDEQHLELSENTPDTTIPLCSISE